MPMRCKPDLPLRGAPYPSIRPLPVLAVPSLAAPLATCQAGPLRCSPNPSRYCASGPRLSITFPCNRCNRNLPSRCVPDYPIPSKPILPFRAIQACSIHYCLSEPAHAERSLPVLAVRSLPCRPRQASPTHAALANRTLPVHAEPIRTVPRQAAPIAHCQSTPARSHLSLRSLPLPAVAGHAGPSRAITAKPLLASPGHSLPIAHCRASALRPMPFPSDLPCPTVPFRCAACRALPSPSCRSLPIHVAPWRATPPLSVTAVPSHYEPSRSCPLLPSLSFPSLLIPSRHCHCNHSEPAHS